MHAVEAPDIDRMNRMNKMKEVFWKNWRPSKK
jgi:hypothetical protein